MSRFTPSRTLYKKLTLVLISILLFSTIFLLVNSKRPSASEFSFSSVNAKEKICFQNSRGSDAYSACMTKVLDEVVDKKGLAFAVDLLNEISDKTDGMHNLCHSVSHAVGKYFYAKYGEQAYTGKYAACSQGYAHGLMQGAAESESVAELSNAVVKICSEPSVGAMSGCVHGAGHAAYDAKIPLTELEKTCKDVIPRLYNPESNSEYPRGEINCIEGWSMQLANTDQLYFNSKSNLDQALEPCKEIEGYYNFGCSTSFARQYIVKSRDLTPTTLSKKFNEYRSFCSVYTEDLEVYLCDFYLGSAIGDIFNKSLGSEKQAKGLLLGCGEKITPQSICLHGFANNLLSLNGNNLKDAEQICSFLGTKFSRESCLIGFQEEAKTYNR